MHKHVFIFAISLALALSQFIFPGTAAAINLEVSMQQLERNKKNVVAFYDLATNQSRPREAVEKYVGEKYTQHNPEVGDGKESFIAHFEKQAIDFPTKRFEFRRVLAEGDFVVVHVYSIFPEYWRNKEWAGIDIFRLDAAGKIVEHWDVLQAIPAGTANKNGMF